MSKTVVLKVRMSCQGCAGTVRRALAQIEGVESFDVNLEEQKVTVTGNVQSQAILDAVSQTGKTASIWDPIADNTLYSAQGDL